MKHFWYDPRPDDDPTVHLGPSVRKCHNCASVQTYRKMPSSEHRWGWLPCLGRCKPPPLAEIDVTMCDHPDCEREYAYVVGKDHGRCWHHIKRTKPRREYVVVDGERKPRSKGAMTQRAARRKEMQDAIAASAARRRAIANEKL